MNAVNCSYRIEELSYGGCQIWIDVYVEGRPRKVGSTSFASSRYLTKQAAEAFVSGEIDSRELYRKMMRGC